MVETKPFKTKLCVLYERGHCARETCTFAHGDTELRRGHDRRSYRDSELRSKLDRKHSPLGRCSPDRDVQGSSAFKSLTPLPSKRRKLRIDEHMDGAIDSSCRFSSPNGTDFNKDKKHASLTSRTILDDELKQVQYELDMLVNQNSHLEIELEQRVQEADILSSRIRDLEAQLCEENYKSQRVSSKIKKLNRAHVHHSWLQDEIKRSQIQLDTLVGELGIIASPIGEEKLNVNIISDEEVVGLNDSASSARKQLYISRENPEELKSEIQANGNVVVVGIRRNSLEHFDGHQEAEMIDKNDIARPANQSKPRRWNYSSKIYDPSNKQQKLINSSLVVPPTSIAAHAIDNFVELVEAEENDGVVGNPKNVEKLPFLLPPLPILSQNTYSQYKGDDENVDVDGHTEDSEEADIV